MTDGIVGKFPLARENRVLLVSGGYVMNNVTGAPYGTAISSDGKGVVTPLGINISDRVALTVVRSVSRITIGRGIRTNDPAKRYRRVERWALPPTTTI